MVYFVQQTEAYMISQWKYFSHIQQGGDFRVDQEHAEGIIYTPPGLRITRRVIKCCWASGLTCLAQIEGNMNG